MPPVTLTEAILDTCEIRPYEVDGLTGRCFEPLAPLSVAKLAWSHGALRRGSECRLEKTSNTRRVISFPWTLELEDRAPTEARLYAKRAKMGRLRRMLVSPFRRSKAQREFETGLKMLACGIRTPLPLLFAERRGPGRLLHENFLVTLGLDGPKSFYFQFRRLDGAEDRLAALEGLARFVRAGYAKGFIHDDCSTHHVFIEGSPAARGADERMYFIDVDNCGFRARIRDADRIKNAFQLFRSMPQPELSEMEKAAFLRTLLERDLSAEEARDYMRRIERFREWKLWRKRIRKAMKGKWGTRNGE